MLMSPEATAEMNKDCERHFWQLENYCCGVETEPSSFTCYENCQPPRCRRPSPQRTVWFSSRLVVQLPTTPADGGAAQCFEPATFHWSGLYGLCSSLWLGMAWRFTNSNLIALIQCYLSGRTFRIQHFGEISTHRAIRARSRTFYVFCSPRIWHVCRAQSW